jgi:alkylation response protein AidB-like acyl-CoA dehydrogenase
VIDETLSMVRQSVRELLAACPADISVALESLGWSEVVDADPGAARMLLFEEQGEALAATTALDGVALEVLGLPAGISVVWPHPRTGAVPTSTRRIDAIHVSGITLGAPKADALVALGSTPGDPLSELHDVVRVSTDGLRVQSIGGFDPRGGWCLVDGVVSSHHRVEGEWSDVVTAARCAVAAELVGVSRGTLAIAIDHVRSREQFGRAIGSYQSVRHRLAEGYAAVVGAAALAAAAFADPTPWSAAAAKATAGWAAADVAGSAMQVCGAMGLSQEHRLPSYVTRGRLLDTLLGSARGIARQQGASLLAGEDPAAHCTP